MKDLGESLSKLIYWKLQLVVKKKNMGLSFYPK